MWIGTTGRWCQSWQGNEVGWLLLSAPPAEEILSRFGLAPEKASRDRLEPDPQPRTLAEDDRELLSSIIYAFVSDSQRSQLALVCEDWLPRTAVTAPLAVATSLSIVRRSVR